MPDFPGGHTHILRLEARLRTKDGRESVTTSDGSWRWKGGLSAASASLRSSAGMIEVKWQKEEAGFGMTVKIPEGIEAETVLPNGV